MKHALIFGLLTLAGVILAALKLHGVIAWPWWLVSAPIWSQGLLILAMFLGCVLYDKYLGGL